MEKLLDQDARIRRAEEIYLRRQNLRERTRSATLSVTKPRNFKLLKRIILQIVICVLIYFIFYLINTTNYSFSEVTLSKIHELLSTDEDFIGICNNFINLANEYIYKLNGEGLGLDKEKQEEILNNEIINSKVPKETEESKNVESETR